MAPPTSLMVAASSQSLVQYPGVVGAGVVVVVVVVVLVEAATLSELSVDVAAAFAARRSSSMEMVEVGGDGHPMNSVVALGNETERYFCS